MGNRSFRTRYGPLENDVGKLGGGVGLLGIIHLTLASMQTVTALAESPMWRVELVGVFTGNLSFSMIAGCFILSRISVSPAGDSRKYPSLRLIDF